MGLYQRGGLQMLILTRRTGQSIQISDDIKITVVRVRGHLVSVGIDAPRCVPVHRSEVHERIQRESAGQVNAKSGEVAPQVANNPHQPT